MKVFNGLKRKELSDCLIEIQQVQIVSGGSGIK